MFIRISKVKTKNKTYTYGQLVESYRRESDGMPTHRIVASLGRLEQHEIDNWRLALKASREGKRVVVKAAPDRKGRNAAAKPVANLQYLDVAVLLELWRDWELDTLLEELMPVGDSDISPAKVIAALVIQRCVAPGSKLGCTRWVPRTALPELLNLAPKQLNNSRMHRVLERLEASESALMSKLTRRYVGTEGAFATLFVDVTDAWFVGHGPELAERGKTKEGLIKRKIGIVLLCNEHGYPVRWDVVSGKSADCKVMGRMLTEISEFGWVGKTPLVCDRAMGHSAEIAQMLSSGLHFVTALTKTEFDSYCPALPHAPFADVKVPADRKKDDEALEQLAEIARSIAGAHEVKPGVFLYDFGVVKVAASEVESDAGNRPAHALAAHPEDAETHDDRAVRAMRLCRRINDAVADGRYRSYNAAGRALGMTVATVKKYRQLAKLAPDIQQDVLAGKAAGSALADLMRIAKLPDSSAQRAAFDALMQAPKRPARRRSSGVAKAADSPPQPVRVRAVAYFNVERFVAARRHAQKTLEETRTFVAQLNSKIAACPTRWTRDKIAASVDRYLRKRSLLDLFKLELRHTEIAERRFPQCVLELDLAAWQRRRRYDGFYVLVTHPDLSLTPEKCYRLYFAKDMIEKDFQVIKSVVKIRPVWHRNDAKVRAHVAICMLALLLERTLRRRLKGTHTACAALEILSSCRLNQYQASGKSSVYITTQLTPEQRKVLRKLRLPHLADDEVLAECISPR